MQIISTDNNIPYQMQKNPFSGLKLSVAFRNEDKPAYNKGLTGSADSLVQRGSVVIKLFRYLRYQL